MTLEEMRADAGLREIAIQPVGTTGYTTLLDPANDQIVIHKYLEQERDISQLRDTLPAFWDMLQSSLSGPTSGYYNWQEIDGSISQKYASIVPINTGNGQTLTLWATTYIEEFSQPALKTEQEINTAITASSDYINRNVNDTQSAFVIVFTILIIVVIALSLLISRFITNPILALKEGAEAIGKGKLDHKLNITSQDELGELATTFHNMGAALKSSMEELHRSADENIAKEREIQDNLRLYAQKVSHAQEAERKRIARELHDETLQALIVVSRQLDDLNVKESPVTPDKIREEVRKIIDGVRQFSQELRPSILDDLGLIPAVKSLCTDLTRNYGIMTEIKVAGSPIKLTADWELMLFRIVQEALNNIRKHSQATQAHVSFLSEAGRVKVTIQDNGIGFEVPSKYEKLTITGKLGIAGMQERIQLLGGTLKIASRPGTGTTLLIDIPLL
jgi:signal transduction histidine kinase